MSSSLTIMFQLFASIIVLAAVLKVSVSSALVYSNQSAGFLGMYSSKFIQAGFVYPKESVRNIIFASVFVSFIFGLVFSIFLAVILPPFILFVLWLFLDRKAKQSSSAQKNINDEICYFIARSLRAGYPLEKAVERTYEQFPKSKVIEQLNKQTSSGFSVVIACEKLIRDSASEISTPEKMVGATIALANQMGGNSARIFDRIGDSFHQSYEVLEDTKAQLSQVRLSAYVICVLPVVMFGLSLLTGSDSTRFMFTHPLGVACLIAGVALEATGIFWMKTMVQRGVGIWAS